MESCLVENDIESIFATCLNSNTKDKSSLGTASIVEKKWEPVTFIIINPSKAPLNHHQPVYKCSHKENHIMIIIKLNYSEMKTKHNTSN